MVLQGVVLGRLYADFLFISQHKNSTLFVPRFCNLLIFSTVEFRGGEVTSLTSSTKKIRVVEKITRIFSIFTKTSRKSQRTLHSNNPAELSAGSTTSKRIALVLTGLKLTVQALPLSVG